MDVNNTKKPFFRTVICVLESTIFPNFSQFFNVSQYKIVCEPIFVLYVAWKNTCAHHLEINSSEALKEREVLVHGRLHVFL